MKEYILSIFFITIFGVLIEIIMPAKTMNKYIKSVYSIFVVAVVLSPIIKLKSKVSDFSIDYNQYEIDKKFIDNYYALIVDNKEERIVKAFEDASYLNVEVEISYSIENDKLIYKYCTINLKNMSTNQDSLHNNIYEFASQIVKEELLLEDKEILFYE